MQITLAYVVSLNGKITQGDNPDVHAWSSTEDWRHFIELRDEHEVIVLDRHTYEAMQPLSELDKLRVVLTSQPNNFAANVVRDKLEFVDATPEKLVAELEKRGYKKILLAGGGRVSADFLSAGIVDYLYLTFEPLLFGTGRPMLAERELDVRLQLESVLQLNGHGTLLAKYRIISSH